jgi:hypothetical protein
VKVADAIASFDHQLLSMAERCSNLDTSGLFGETCTAMP